MADKAAQKKEKKPFSLQENVEWIAIAFVLALTVRAFVVEAYQIPTGSMAPTLYGENYQVTCASCGTTFVVKHDAGSRIAFYVCPVCGATSAQPPAKVTSHGGDRILVVKDLYTFTKPRRWDIFVFKAPPREQRLQNFVKRLVGLPGEALELKDGDLFIDGRVAEKPERIQKTLWQDAYDCSRDPSMDSNWKREGDWQVSGRDFVLPKAEAQWQTIRYVQPITDFYAYNAVPGDNIVGDLLLSGRAKLADGASMAAAVSSDKDATKATFAREADAMTVTLALNDKDLQKAVVSIGSSDAFDFSLSSVDGVREASVNGAVVARDVKVLTPDDVPLYTKSSGVSLQGAGGAVRLSDVRIKRDIYYRISARMPDCEAGRPFFAQIPKDSYFALGDNSPLSDDSRDWGFAPAENVVGRAFFVFWPPLRIGPAY